MRIIPQMLILLAKLLDMIDRFFHWLSCFFCSFLAAILTPKEMVEYSKCKYENKFWPGYTDFECISQGFSLAEQRIVDRFVRKDASVLVLGCGGGRESIALAKLGLKVTGIDASENMVRLARENAVKEGVSAEFEKGDFIDLSLHAQMFDYCLLSCFMYSSIPTRTMRIKVLEKVRGYLRGGGSMFIQFNVNPERKTERLFEFRKFLSRIFNGNREYAIGDQFWPPLHFWHHFSSEQEVVDEAREAGFILKGAEKESTWGIILALENVA